MLYSTLQNPKADTSVVDGAIHIWHRENGQLLETLDGHTACANAVAWNPSNPRMLASVGDDKRVVIWTAGPGLDDEEAVNGHTNGFDVTSQSARNSGIYV